MKDNQPVLLVEDDVVDAMTVSRSFRELSISNEVIHRINGVEALEYLKGTERQPCLILLDINMPKMNGIEFLEKVKRSEGHRRIPVVVLTTSNDQRDKLEAFNLGVAGYMLKPMDYSQFVTVVKDIDRYWTISELPS
jgi:CheY-like chemotaxis protein